MCLAMEGIIVEVRKRQAIAETMGVKRTVSVELMEDIKMGDKVMIHAGTVIAKVKEENE